MKKNVVGHMMTPKVSKKTKFKSLGIFSRLLCLLIAIVVWLLVVNIQGEGTSNTDEQSKSDITVTLP